MAEREKNKKDSRFKFFTAVGRRVRPAIFGDRLSAPIIFCMWS